MEESRQGWRRGGNRRIPVTSGGKGWQSRKQPAAKTGVSRQRTRLVAFGVVAIGLLVAYIVLVIRVPRDMPLVVLGVTSYESPIPPNAYVSEDAKRLAGTNRGNIKLMPAKPDRIVGREALEGYLKENLRPTASYVNQGLITIYLSAHGVVDSQGHACLLLSDSKPLDETTWYPISKLFDLLDEERPDAVKVLLLDSGKIDVNWSLGILHNAFPDRVAAALRNHGKIFVITDRASGQLAWSAPERDGTIFGHFVASGLSAAADADNDDEVSLLEFYDFVRSNVDAWVSDNRASRQTPQLMPQRTELQNIKLVNSGAGPSGNRSAKDHVSKLASNWREDVLPLWERYEKYVGEVDLERYDPLGLATIEAELLRAEQLLFAGDAYKIEYTETVNNVRSLMSDAAKPSLPDKLRRFSLPLAAQLERGFDPETSGQELFKAWLEAEGWPKDEEGKDKEPVAQSYLEAANVAVRWLRDSPGEPGGRQLSEAFRLFKTSGRHIDDQKVPIEHVQEVQLLRLVLEHADVTDADNWPSELRSALRQAMLAQKLAEQIAAPADERVHYWVQPLVNTLDQRRRTALDRIFIGDDASLKAARDELAQCQKQEGDAAEQRLEEVAKAYELRDRVSARLPHIAFWFSQQGRLDERQLDLDLALQGVDKLSGLLDTDDTTQRLDITDQNRPIIDDLRAASEKLENEFGQHVARLRVATPASGTLLDAHRVLRTPLVTARYREDLFLDKYLASMALDHYEPAVSGKPSQTDSPKLTDPAKPTRWPTHPAVLFAGHDELTAPGTSKAVQDDAVSWFDVQGGFVRNALRDISNKKSRLQQATEVLLRSEAADATARSTRSDLAKADAMVRSAAALLGRRPWKVAADPTRRLRHVDRHFQLLWHSHRVLEDFWGPTVSLEGKPYFANVADSYFDGAKTLASESKVLRYANTDLIALRGERSKAATETVITPGAALKCFEPDKTINTDYEFSVSWNQNLPPGQAAVFITERVDNDPKRLFPVLVDSVQVRRRGQDVHLASHIAQVLQLVKPAGDRFELPLAARVLFRGHEQAQPFTAQWPKHTMPVRAQYTHPDKAKVTVEGDEDRNAYIMFIVDCSGTMSQKARMADAKNSLRDIVAQLGAQPNYKIGLRAYGRRAGFKTQDMKPVRNNDGDYIILNRDADGKLVEVTKNGLHPDEDANDRLVDFNFAGRDQAAHVGEVIERVDELTPLGLTPLYRSLVESLSRDFKNLEGDSKHIVLVTDGVNNVSSFKAVGKTIPQTSAQDVLDAWKGTDVRIHIIFMEPPPTLEKALTDIPNKTEGIYRGANKVDELVKGIQEAIGLVKFSVDPVDPHGSSNSETTKYRLGETATVTELRRNYAELRPNYEVRIHGAPVAASDAPTRKIYLDGGEAAKLIYEHQLNQSPRLMFPIEYPPEAYGDARVVAGLNRDGKEHRFVVRAHRPDVKGADVDFFVTIQDVTDTSERAARTAHFTPPVRQVWCEITPVEGNTPLTDQRYYFYDVDNVLDQPIPKLRFHAKDWFRTAKKAEMTVWFSFDQVRPTQMGLRGKEVDASGKRQSFSVPGLAGVKFDVSGQKLSDDEPYRLTIDETNPALGTAIILVSPAPDAISHTYYAFGIGEHVVKHVYEFDRRQTIAIDVLTSMQFKKEMPVISVPPLDVIW